MLDLVGRRFGDLEVVAFHGISSKRKRLWLCRCLSTFRLGEPCNGARIVETGFLNKPGGRRCRKCSQHLMQERAHQTSRWIYK